MKQKTFIFIGRSGCGKGTQIKLLEEKLQELDSERKIVNVGLGSDLREFWSKEGFSNDLSKTIMEEGELQPEFLVVYLWGRNLMKNMAGDEHLVLDGTPRRLNEAEVLDSAIRFYKREEPIVVYLNVSREWSIERLTNRGRADDDIEQINKRLDWFDRDVVPAIDYLKNDSLYNFIEVNGEQSIEEVYQEMIEKINFKD